MTRPFTNVREAISRWASREQRFLGRQFHSKTLGVRFDGLRRSKRNEAKLFLLAMAPMVFIGPFIGRWSDASRIGKTILTLLAIWFGAVLVVGSLLLFRALARASRGRSDNGNVR